MRTLVLMRHAQPEPFSAVGDKGRELTEQGRSEAAVVGAQLADKGIQHALVSTAVRTRQTFENLGLDVAAEFMDALYDCGSETLLQRIGEIDDEVTGLLVLGHAPAIPALSAELAYASDAQEADRLLCWFPAATYTVFELDGSWADLAAGSATDFGGVHRVHG